MEGCSSATNSNRSNITIPENYRPIASELAISEVMERVINIELIKYLRMNKINNDRKNDLVRVVKILIKYIVTLVHHQ